MTDLPRARIAEILEGLDWLCFDSEEERAIVADHLAAALSDTTPRVPHPSMNDAETKDRQPALVSRAPSHG